MTNSDYNSECHSDISPACVPYLIAGDDVGALFFSGRLYLNLIFPS